MIEMTHYSIKTIKSFLSQLYFPINYYLCKNNYYILCKFENKQLQSYNEIVSYLINLNLN